MLQDLDHITARIGQLAERTRLLHAERNALRARVEDAERLARSLRDQCAQRDAAILELQARVDERDEEVVRKLAAVQASEQTLKSQLEQAHVAHEEIVARLAAREDDVLRLGRVAGQARARIDSVLARLPGAAVAEES